MKTEASEPKPTATPPRRSRAAWPLLTATAILLTSVLLVGFVVRARAAAQLRATAAEASAPEVGVIIAQPSAAARELILPSTTESWQRTAVRPRATGYVKGFSVDIGAHVKAGEVLAEIETPDLDQEFRAAESAVREADANAGVARLNADRYGKLLDQKAVSKQEVDERQATFKAAEARQYTAQANLQRLRELREFQRVTAPFAGVITARRAEPGNLVSANNPADAGLFTLEQVDRLRVFASVPQNESRGIQIGQTAELLLREFPGESFPGKVVRTAGAIDPVTRTLRVEVEVPNPDRKLVAGSYAQVRFQIVPTAPALLVPVSAVMFRSAAATVAVVGEGNVVQLRTVQLGRDLGTQLEIASGLQAGDRVVRNPNDTIRPGAKVQVSAPADGTAKGK